MGVHARVGVEAVRSTSFPSFLLPFLLSTIFIFVVVWKEKRRGKVSFPGWEKWEERRKKKRRRRSRPRRDFPLLSLQYLKLMEEGGKVKKEGERKTRRKKGLRKVSR